MRGTMSIPVEMMGLAIFKEEEGEEGEEEEAEGTDTGESGMKHHGSSYGRADSLTE